MSEKTRVVKAAGVVGFATFTSRIFGYIRDAVIAWYFGAGLSTDVFIVAFRIPNLVRRLFAEGSLSQAFIPVFTEYLTTEGKIEAFKLARSGLRLLSIILVLIVVVGILLSPWIIRTVAPGFSESPEKFALTVTLTRILFPYIFFICLVALCMGILNVLGHFAAPALAPVLLNIAMIGSVFLIVPFMSEPIIGLAIGVVVGGVLQLALQLPFLVRNGFVFWQKAAIYHPGLKSVGRMLVPVIFGGSVYQINILASTYMASLLGEGSITYLYFADRLIQFPLGIFAIAAGTAVLPSLSRLAAANDYEALRATFLYALKFVFFITIPAMIGLILLREPIVALLFQRGEFDGQATRLTAYALLYYAIGLWAFSGTRIVVATFFALQDTKTPVKAAVVSILANIVIGFILMGPLEHGGLALATSLASVLNLGLLIRALKAKLGPLGWTGIAKSVGRTLLGSLSMGIAVWLIAFIIIPENNAMGPHLLLGVIGSIACGLCIYGLFAYLIKSPELTGVFAEVKKGFTKK